MLIPTAVHASTSTVMMIAKEVETAQLFSEFIIVIILRCWKNQSFLPVLVKNVTVSE